jgi:hypothetical protein
MNLIGTIIFLGFVLALVFLKVTVLGTMILGGFLLALVIGLEIEDRICSQLRSKHPELWQELGSPDRYFDDGGLMRHAALAKLFRSPDLLLRCSDIGREIRFARSFERICFALGWIAAGTCLAYVLAQK